MLPAGHYLQFNYTGHSGTPLHRVYTQMITVMPGEIKDPEASADSLWPFAYSFWRTRDMRGISLCLLGDSDQGTGWHRDPGGAHTIALRTPGTEVSIEEPLAVWIFISPGREFQVAQYLVRFTARLDCPAQNQRMCESHSVDSLKGSMLCSVHGRLIMITSCDIVN